MQNLATGEIADSVREIASFRTKIKDIGSKVSCDWCTAEHINVASTASAACRQQSCCSHFADSFEPQMLASDCKGVITGLFI